MAGVLASVVLLAAVPASAETVEFVCYRSDVSKPLPYYWRVDLSASVATYSPDTPNSMALPAVITPTSMEWQHGTYEKWYLDRMSGHMTGVFSGDKVEFQCQRSTGF
jgi:hypothetical protein